MLKFRSLIVAVVLLAFAQSAFAQDVVIGAGEIRFDGTVVSYDAAAKKLVMNVASFTLPSGKSSKLAAPKPKTVLLAAETKMSAVGAGEAAPLLVAGAPVMVIAKEAGTGKDVTARLVMVAAPQAGSTPGASEDGADPNDVALKPGEVRFDARVTGILSANNITVSVFSTTDEKGETQELFPTLTKTILMNAATPLRSRGDASKKLTVNDLKIGSRVTFSGKDGGAKIKATEVAVWEEDKSKSESIGSVSISGPVSMLLKRADQATDAKAYEEGVKILTTALRTAEGLGDRAGRGLTLDRLANAYEEMNQPQKALDHFEKALSVWRGLGDTQNESTTLNNLGIFYMRSDQKDKAVETLERAVKLSRGGDPRGVALTLQNLAGAYSGADKMDKSIETMLEALPFVKQTRKTVDDETMLLSRLARAYAEQKNTAKANEYSEQALALIDQVGEKMSQAYVARVVASAYANTGQKPKALELYKRAQGLYTELEQKEEGERVAKAIENLDKPAEK